MDDGRRTSIFVGQAGGASSLLHDGPQKTPQIEGKLQFRVENGMSQYHFRLFHAAEDRLIFAEEKYCYTPTGEGGSPKWNLLGPGHRESLLKDPSVQQYQTARVLHHTLRNCVVYQFHNTTNTARIKQRWDVYDGRFLKEDAGNLAPFLLRLQNDKPTYYARIVETCAQIAPFFADFVLEPSAGRVLLQWREHGSDIVFGPHQMSDGTLRAISLVSLLLQPEEDLPKLLVLDEPELGLHPYAIEVIAGLLRAASIHSQIFAATQSSVLIAQLEPEEIVVVERHGRTSEFHQLDSGALEEWLKEYSLPELWDKGVLGGRPTR